MRHDFTFIDETVEGVVRVLNPPATLDPTLDADAPDPFTSSAHYRLFNIGIDRSTDLLRYVEVLEDAPRVKATK